LPREKSDKLPAKFEKFKTAWIARYQTMKDSFPDEA